MPQEGYRGPQVCKIVGITYRQLDHWDRTGLKSPSLEQAKGSGTQRLYSYQDVVELRIIKQLLDAGVTLQRARKAIDFLRESGDDLASASLVLGAAGSVLSNTMVPLLATWFRCVLLTCASTPSGTTCSSSSRSNCFFSSASSSSRAACRQWSARWPIMMMLM